MAEPFVEPIACDPLTETCPEDFAPGLTCDPDFEDCPEVPDPELLPGEEETNVPAEDAEDGNINQIP